MSIAAINAVKRTLASPTCKLKPLARFVLVLLAEYAGKNGTCWPSRGTLAELTGTSQPSIKRALRELERGNYVRRSARHTESGAQTANLFEVMASRGDHGRPTTGSRKLVGGIAGDPGPGSKPALPYKEEPSLEPTSEPSVAAADYDRRTKVDPAGLCEKLMAEANGALNPLAKGMGLQSVSEVIGWIQSGADVELDILPAVREVAHRARPGSVRAWSYFRGAVADYRARREIGLPPPSAHIVNGSHAKPSHMRRYA